MVRFISFGRWTVACNARDQQQEMERTVLFESFVVIKNNFVLFKSNKLTFKALQLDSFHIPIGSSTAPTLSSVNAWSKIISTQQPNLYCDRHTIDDAIWKCVYDEGINSTGHNSKGNR